MLTKQQFNVYLPPDLIRLIKHKVVDMDQSLSTFVEEALVAYLNRLEGQAEQEPEMLTSPDPTSMDLMTIVYPADVERSVNFYRLLGFKLHTDKKMWAELRIGAAMLGLQGGDPYVRGEQIKLVLVSQVPLEAVISELEAKGIHVENEIADEAFGRSLLLHDPDGNPILINEYDPELYP